MGVPLAQQFGIPQIDPLSDIIGVVFLKLRIVGLIQRHFC